MVIKTKKLQNKCKKIRKTKKKVMKGGGNSPVLNKVTGLPINQKELEMQKAALQSAISAPPSGRRNITAQIKADQAAALKLKESQVAQPPPKRQRWKLF